ncbi:hypothetical protein FRC10_005012 [Ceratobasidium sp. 414]|nr:hypothetical protein FRC10_005012 [Ceratobasidium sp. 414]
MADLSTAVAETRPAGIREQGANLVVHGGEQPEWAARPEIVAVCQAIERVRQCTILELHKSMNHELLALTLAQYYNTSITDITLTMVALKLGSLVILLASAYAAPTDLSTLDKRTTQTARRLLLGTSQTGTSSSGLPGGCPAAASSIATCYVQKLSSKPNENLDPNLATTGPVQTNFISTNAVEATGGVTEYTFKLFLEPGLATPSSAGSVPLVQIVSKEPVDGQGSATKVWLDAQNNEVGIYAFSNTPMVSVPLSQFVGKMTVHTWTVKGGPQGYANIDIKDTAGKSTLKYSVNKPNTVDSYR